MSKLALVAAVLLGGCVATMPAGRYGYWHHHHRGRVIYVDGVTYLDRGVEYGPAPADTIIPDEDPPVGQLTPPSGPVAP